MRNNPASKGYEFLDEGSFATVYEKDGRVELIIKPELHDTSKDPKAEYDLSRELPILARRSAPSAARKYIPEIKRERIDIGEIEGFRVAEIVYSMPTYRHRLSLKNQTYLAHIMWGTPPLKILPKGLSDALAEIGKIGKAHGAEFDFVSGNFSQHKGHLIFRDPLCCVQSGYESIRMSELWPADQMKLFNLSPVRIDDEE
jgi:hypothetical protein